MEVKKTQHTLKGVFLGGNELITPFNEDDPATFDIELFLKHRFIIALGPDTDRTVYYHVVTPHAVVEYFDFSGDWGAIGNTCYGFNELLGDPDDDDDEGITLRFFAVDGVTPIIIDESESSN